MKRPRASTDAHKPHDKHPPDASFRRALVKKLRRAQATLEEHRRAAAGSSDGIIIDDEKRRDNARLTIETTLKRIADAFGASAVKDADVVEALGEGAVVAAEVNVKRRSEGDARRRERERLDAEEKASRKREREKGGGETGVWALHAMAKSAGEAEAAAAASTVAIADAADACARDAEFAKTRAVSAGMWAVAKISSALNDDDGDNEKKRSGAGGSSASRALGKAMNALAKRCARLESSDVDARGASGALWSLATTARTPTGPHVDDVLARRATNFAASALNACASRANAQDAANALWGAAKLRKALEESCVQSLVDALAKPGAEVKTEELSIALWSLATLGTDGLANATSLAMPIVRRAKETAKKQPKSWSAQATANAAWAGGKLATADGTTETDVRDARQMVTQLFAIAKTLTLTAQGFAHVARACASVETEARLVADLAKFVVAGLKTHERALTGADLASVVEACQTLNLHTSMSDGAKLVEEVRRAVERGVDAFDWQAVGRLDVAIEGVVGEKIEGELRQKLNARGVAVCAEVDAHRLDLEKGSADALLNTADETSALVAPMDNPTLLVVDDKHRLITKRLRRVGWQTTMWQRFSCGEHVEGSCWPESDDKDWFGAAVVRAPTTKASLAMILHVVAAKVQFGGKVWIYGAATEGLKSIIPDLPKGLFENAKLVMHDAEYGVVSCVRSQAQPDKKGKELKKWRDKKMLDLAPAVVGSSAAKKTTSLPWTSYPGLFAGGGLDVMTSLLLRRLLPTLDRKAKLKALDYCSGNGVVAAGIQLAAKKTKLTLLDADAIALDAAKKNLPRGESSASFILSDAWTRVEPSETYDLIVSNPPVHHGLAVDFHPTRALLQSLPVRLDETSGVAYIVTQRYVPFRAIASSVVSPSSAVSIACEHADARFVVWTCRRRAR